MRVPLSALERSKWKILRSFQKRRKKNEGKQDVPIYVYKSSFWQYRLYYNYNYNL